MVEQFPAPLADEIGGVEVEQQVAVGLARLQEALAAGHIVVDRLQVLPERICRLEVHGGIEVPARPEGIGRRHTGAVIYDVVHAGEEVVVQRGLDISQGTGEMLAEPGASLGRGEFLACDV